MLIKGDTYPSRRDEIRIQEQNKYEALLLNITSGNFKYIHNSQGKITREQIDPIVPLPQTISDISGDLLMGEPPTITVPEKFQDDYDTWSFNSGLDSNLLESATYVSALGTVYSRMFSVDGVVTYDFIPANRVTYTKSLGKFINVKIIDSITPTKNQKNKEYEIQEYNVEDNGQVSITNYVATIRQTDNEVINTQIISIETPEGLDFIPVAEWKNIGIMGTDQGRSDYVGKEQLFSEIDNRIDQNNNVLQENSEPWKIVPSGILDQNGQLNRASMTAKMIERAPSGDNGANTVDILTWDGSLEASFSQIDKMTDMVFFTARISNAISGRGKGGTGDSGRALKWQSVSTIAMMNRKKRYAGDFLREFVYQWSRLSGFDIEKKEVKVEWQDGFPLDEGDRVDSIVKQYNSGLISKDKAVSLLQEINGKELEQEVLKIQNDETERVKLEAQSTAPLTL